MNIVFLKVFTDFLFLWTILLYLLAPVVANKTNP